MKNRNQITILIAVLIFLVGGIFYWMYSQQEQASQQPERPISISETAVWIGGVDGGNWFDCFEKNEQKGIIYCEIYTDTGFINWRGEFYFAEYTSGSLSEFISSISAYSGSELYLRSGSYKQVSIPLKHISYDDLSRGKAVRLPE